MRTRVVLLAAAAVIVASAVGAGWAWYRVADSYTVTSQTSAGVAGLFGALSTIGFAAAVAAGFASRRAAARQRAARVDTVALAAAAVEAMLQRSLR